MTPDTHGDPSGFDPSTHSQSPYGQPSYGQPSYGQPNEPTTHDAQRNDVDGPPPPAESFGDKVNRFARKFAIALVFIALAVITYLILANFLPQWWAQRIAERVEGRFSSGIWTGATLGFICTLLPIVFICLAVVNRGRLKNILSLGFVVLAVIAAIPNLLTLSIVLGRSSGAYRGQNILDVAGPGFRGAGVWGAIVAVVVGAIICYYIWRFRRRGRELAKVKAAQTDPPN